MARSGQRRDRVRRRRRVTAGAAAKGSRGRRSAFDFDGVDGVEGVAGLDVVEVVEVVDGVGLPRLLELAGFLVFDDVVEDFAVVVVEDFAVVVVEDFAVDEPEDFAVVEPEDFAVVGVVDGLRVVAVVEDGPVVDGLEGDWDAAAGPVEFVVDADDEDAADWACVTWMLTWPSLESEFPSLATKLKASTSTPAGAW